MSTPDERTEFDYLLNAFEHASQSEAPAKHGYADKRKALFAYVRKLEQADAASNAPLTDDDIQDIAIEISWPDFGDNDPLHELVHAVEQRHGIHSAKRSELQPVAAVEGQTDRDADALACRAAWHVANFRDAERYRKLRLAPAWYQEHGRMLWGDELDKAIDAAISSGATKAAEPNLPKDFGEQPEAGKP